MSGGAVDGEHDEQADRLDVAESLRQRRPGNGKQGDQRDEGDGHSGPAGGGRAESEGSGRSCEPRRGGFVEEPDLDQREHGQSGGEELVAAPREEACQAFVHVPNRMASGDAFHPSPERSRLD
ncbi:MAG TPA: hypothetical protein VGJ27_01695 [Gaiellaceae bacterium]